jgi:hypothetical protein
MFRLDSGSDIDKQNPPVDAGRNAESPVTLLTMLWISR